MASASELLSQVESAITSCLTAQSYSIAGQKVMAQLAQLREFRKELLDEIANGSNSSGSMATLCKLEEPTL
jgi:FixJ family two-component response regulator